MTASTSTPNLLLARRLEERVDAALGVEQPLGAQAEHEHDGLSGPGSGWSAAEAGITSP